jgi:hypothetical protein
VENEDEIITLKEQISIQFGIPISKQKIFFDYKELVNNKVFLDYNISNNSRLDLIST